MLLVMLFHLGDSRYRHQQRESNCQIACDPKELKAVAMLTTEMRARRTEREHPWMFEERSLGQEWGDPMLVLAPHINAYL